MSISYFAAELRGIKTSLTIDYEDFCILILRIASEHIIVLLTHRHDDKL
jgi:hypothetical protein